MKDEGGGGGITYVLTFLWGDGVLKTLKLEP